MKRAIYAIYDNVAKDIIQDQLWLERSNAQALRNFQMAMQNPKSLLAQFPNDYDLVTLGFVDDEGKIHGVELQHDANGKLLTARSLWEIIIRGKDMYEMANPITPDKPELKLAGGDK